MPDRLVNSVDLWHKCFVQGGLLLAARSLCVACRSSSITHRSVPYIHSRLLFERRCLIEANRSLLFIDLR